MPPETIHWPIETGPYRMAMGLTTAPEPAWFEFDALYPSEMAERRRLLADLHTKVFAVRPESDAARRETLDLVAQALAGHHPGWFRRDGTVLHNHLTTEAWDLAHPPLDPLELAGRLVQEDLCLIQLRDGTPVFTAGVLCFPSRWRMDEKIGRPLAEVHGPVPLYADRLERPVDRFMRHVKVGHIATRLNWSILDNPALYQPTGKWRQDSDTVITPENAGEGLYLRVERQTLRRLPASDAILFGIRVHNYRLDRLIDSPARAGQLADAVRALPDSVVLYKSMVALRAPLLAWLDRRAGG
ncbi:MAG: DUF3445 domain-containing protein [Acetobacteraceae bacterium]